MLSKGECKLIEILFKIIELYHTLTQLIKINEKKKKKNNHKALSLAF